MTIPFTLFEAIITLTLLLILLSVVFVVIFLVRWLLDPFSGESPLAHLNEGDQYDDD